MCCGSKRTALRQAAPTPRPASTGPALGAAAPVQTPAPVVRLGYRPGQAIGVAGPVTGRAYAFPAAAAPLDVNPKDAAALIRTGLFVRA